MRRRKRGARAVAWVTKSVTTRSEGLLLHFSTLGSKWSGQLLFLGLLIRGGFFRPPIGYPWDFPLLESFMRNTILALTLGLAACQTSPPAPLSDAELIAKLRANCDGVLDAARQDAVIEATWAFDECADVGDYMKLLVV